MNTDDVQYLDWQWVEEHPESALDLMLKLHSENAALREKAERYRLVTLRQDADNTALCNELAKLQEWTNQIRDDLEEACSERDANWEKVGNLVDLLIESLKHLDNHNLAREGTELVHKIKMAVIQDRGLWE